MFHVGKCNYSGLLFINVELLFDTENYRHAFGVLRKETIYVIPWDCKFHRSIYHNISLNLKQTFVTTIYCGRTTNASS